MERLLELDSFTLLCITLLVSIFLIFLFYIAGKLIKYSPKNILNFSHDLNKAKTKPLKQDIQDNKDSTLIGTNQSSKNIYVDDNAKHIFVCGTTGSGKTVALSNFIKRSIDKDFPMLIIDGKGDIGSDSILDITKKLKQNKKLYVIDLNNPKTSDKYNPFKNASSTVIKDMLINMTEWSEEHYKSNTERYLQRLIDLMTKANLSFSLANIVKHIYIDKFIELSLRLEKDNKITKLDHLENLEIAKASGKITEGAAARFSTLIESDIGTIFDESGIDIYTALSEKAIILFILNPLIYPVVSPLIGNLIIIDSKKAVSLLFNSNKSRIFFIMDEINVYASSSMLDLVNKSRSAKVTCILATQSLSDLDSANGEYFKEQIIENCNNYILLRQNSSKNAEQWANIIGTKDSLSVTYQIDSDNNTSTGKGTITSAKEYLYHPDVIKNLTLGNGIYICKENGFHSRVKINKPY